jgi:hypothetical protein
MAVSLLYTQRGRVTCEDAGVSESRVDDKIRQNPVMVYVHGSSSGSSSTLKVVNGDGSIVHDSRIHVETLMSGG